MNEWLWLLPVGLLPVVAVGAWLFVRKTRLSREKAKRIRMMRLPSLKALLQYSSMLWKKLKESYAKIFLSRRVAVKRETLLKRLEKGVVIKGIVKSLNCYGARLDLGGVEGVLNIDNMAWKRIKHPSKLLSIGDEIQVKVLEYGKEKKWVSVGLKQLSEDPWAGVETRYPPGTRVTGKVTKIAYDWCFVEIEKGVEGMVHIDDMAWRRIKRSSELLSVGDEIQAKVLKYNKEKKRVWLGLKQLSEDPWVGVETRYPPGTRTTGKVMNIVDYGCFVEIEEGINGLLHISDMAWRQIKHPSELLSKGDEIQAKVLKYKKEKKQVWLGLKQLSEDPWVGVETRYPPGTQVTGKVTNITKSGCSVETEEGINGFLHISNMAWRRIKHPSELLSRGDEIQAKVLKYEKEKKRVWLGLKQLSEDPWVEFVRRYGSGSGKRITCKVTDIAYDRCFVETVETEERIEGVVHIGDMAWRQIKHPSELLSKGEEIQAKVLECDEEKKQVSLGLKQLSEDPWVRVDRRHPPGKQITGKVTNITKRGCSVEIEEGIEGLLHIDNIAWKRIKYPSELLSIGDEIQVKVLKYDKEKKRMWLSLKQLAKGPWVEFVKRYPPGTRITRKVTKIADDRCLVEIEEGVEGVVHIDDMALRQIKHPSELFSVGDEIQVQVLEHNKEKKQVRLSLKQLDEGP